MNITILTTIFPPDVGGPATYVYEVLNRLRAKGHNIKVITYSQEAKDPDVYVVPQKLKRSKPLRFCGVIYAYFCLLFYILKTFQGSHLIFLQNASFPATLALLVAKVFRKPLALRYPGDGAWESAFAGKGTRKYLDDFLAHPEAGLYVRLLLAMQRFTLHRVNKIIAPSYYLKRVLENHYQINPQRIKVINNAIDPRDYDRSAKPYKGHRIIAIGRLVRYKRMDGIVRAVAKLCKSYPDIELVIVGEGDERENLEELSQQLGIQKQVKIPGRASHNEVIALLKTGSMFVLNSVYEGQPFLVMEAMACKIPVIATNIEGSAEIVDDGKTGLLVAVDDNGEELQQKIALLLENGLLRKRLVENAYNSIIHKFTWERNLNILEEELEGAIVRHFGE